MAAGPRGEQGLAMAQAATIGLPADLVAEAVSIYKSPYRLAVNLSVKVSKNQTYRLHKFVAFSREGWGGDASVDLQLAKAARTEGFDQLLAEHRAAWQQLWQSDILIDGDARAQQAVHSELYYLLSSSTADTAWPLGACAITPGYAGHAFWDSDTWMFPALLLLHPERAKSLVMFRTRTLAAAQSRAHERHLDGAMYPWESDPQNGSEQTPHSAYILGEREIHVDADIAIAQWQYYLATRDLDWLKNAGWPVIRELARFWASRATYVPQRHRYEILQVTSVQRVVQRRPERHLHERLRGQGACSCGERSGARRRTTGSALGRYCAPALHTHRWNPRASSEIRPFGSAR
jgi:protein-glucosylgalactosylhydroxylysine glucosidase